MMNASLVGIIANPASGKDIRRLVAYATTVSNQDKVGIVRRILVGLQAVGIKQALIMPDINQLGYKAVRGLPESWRDMATIMEQRVTGQSEDSRMAAAALQQQGASAIVILGGDGTVRIVSESTIGFTLLLVI